MRTSGAIRLVPMDIGGGGPSVGPTGFGHETLTQADAVLGRLMVKTLPFLMPPALQTCFAASLANRRIACLLAGFRLHSWPSLPLAFDLARAPIAPHARDGPAPTPVSLDNILADWPKPRRAVINPCKIA